MLSYIIILHCFLSISIILSFLIYRISFKKYNENWSTSTMYKIETHTQKIFNIIIYSLIILFVLNSLFLSIQCINNYHCFSFSKLAYAFKNK